MAFSDEQITSLRSTLQLEDTADEAAIVAAVDAVVAENLEERTQGNTVPEGQVMIPAARLADLEAGARAGTEAAQALRNKECQEAPGREPGQVPAHVACRLGGRVPP